jgi:hypothetical protein
MEDDGDRCNGPFMSPERRGKSSIPSSRSWASSAIGNCPESSSARYCTLEESTEITRSMAGADSGSTTIHGSK